METWRSRAKAHMKSRKITQEKLAEMLGVTQGAVGHWLSGRREPGIDIVMAIAACIDMPFAEMASGLILHDDNHAYDHALDAKATQIKRSDFILHGSMDYFVTDNPSPLITAINNRIIPPHIEQAIMTLLATCPEKSSKPSLSENEQKVVKVLEEMHKNAQPGKDHILPDLQEAFINPEPLGGVDRTIAFLGDDDQAVDAGQRDKKAVEK